LLEELLHTLCILGLIGVDFRVDALKIGLRDNSGSTMSGARDKKDIKIVLFDKAVHMSPSERLAGIGSPMPQKASFEMLKLEWFHEQWVFTEVEHSQAKVHASPEICMHLANLLGVKRLPLQRRASLSISGNALLARI
jgi:hypothetical protein